MSTGAICAQDLYIIERDGYYGFANRLGTPVIPPAFEYAVPFSEGLAVVRSKDRWGYINKTGEYAIPRTFEHAEPFSDGLAAILSDPPDLRWGYIDRNGNVVIEPRYSNARQFSEGLAPVLDKTGWVFIDRHGNPLKGASIPPVFEDALPFAESLAAVRSEGRRWGYINKTGEYAICPIFENAMSFAEGLAAVRSEGRWGYIDKTGQYVIPPVFEDAMSFSEGLAAVCSKDRWGYINKTGEYAIAPAFSVAEPFSEGLAAVTAGLWFAEGAVGSDKGWGYINKTGEIRIPTNFPFFADGFVGGLAVVSDPVRGAQIYIDSAGKSTFLMSSKRRPIAAYAVAPPEDMCSLELRSEPQGADIYLIPAYIWDQGDRGRPAPSQLKGSNLKEYLDEHFDFRVQEGRTNVKARVIEQNYVALFFLADDMQRLWLDIRKGENSASVYFDHK